PLSTIARQLKAKGLQWIVLAAAALTVALVADHDPLQALGLELAGDRGERLAGGARQRIDALAGLAGEGVQGAEERGVADLVGVTAEAQPRPGWRDVVRGGLALRLDEDRQVDEVLAVPRHERTEKLEPFAVGRHFD